MMAPKKEKIRGLREFTETCLAFSGPSVSTSVLSCTYMILRNLMWPPPTNALARARTRTYTQAPAHTHTHAAQSSSRVVASAHLSYVCAVSDETATVAMKTAATVRDNMIKAEKAMVCPVLVHVCVSVCVCVCVRARARASWCHQIPTCRQGDSEDALQASRGRAEGLTRTYTRRW